MSDFFSGGWGVYIAVVTIVSIIACAVLLQALTTRKLAPGEKPGTTGHTWDDDLSEYNHPLPRWWLYLFWITLVFGVVYLILYPGLGAFDGTLKWSQTGAYQLEVKEADATYGPLYAKYASLDIPAVAKDAQALAMGQRLFLNHCAGCHASDGGGSRGFPNLTDGDWLYGGDPKTIETTITQGRNGIMPPLGAALGEQGVKEVANYVLSLSGRTHNEGLASTGKTLFQQNCAACHGADGKGNQMLGAPNLTDNVWLYGSSIEDITEGINKGRNNVMPAHGPLLGPNKVHLLAAYVYSLSQGAGLSPGPIKQPASGSASPAK